MPKEVIKDGYGGVTLGWGKDSVQIGLDLDREFSFTDNKESYTGLWWTFNSRDEMNRLIRSLRKARDSTFGRDA